MQLPVRRVSPSDVAYAKQVIKEYIRAKDGDMDYNDVRNLTGPLGELLRADGMLLNDIKLALNWRKNK